MEGFLGGSPTPCEEEEGERREGEEEETEKR